MWFLVSEQFWLRKNKIKKCDSASFFELWIEMWDHGIWTYRFIFHGLTFRFTTQKNKLNPRQIIHFLFIDFLFKSKSEFRPSQRLFSTLKLDFTKKNAVSLKPLCTIRFIRTRRETTFINIGFTCVPSPRLRANTSEPAASVNTSPRVLTWITGALIYLL